MSEGRGSGGVGGRRVGTRGVTNIVFKINIFFHFQNQISYFYILEFEYFHFFKNFIFVKFLDFFWIQILIKKNSNG